MLQRFTPTIKQLLLITVCSLNVFLATAQTQIDNASNTSEWTDGNHTISTDGNEFTVTNTSDANAKWIAKSFGTPVAGAYKVFFTAKNASVETPVRAFVKLGGSWYKKSADTAVKPNESTTITFSDKLTDSDLLDDNNVFTLDGNTSVSIGINVRKKTSANGGTPVSIVVDDITLQAVTVNTITNTFNGDSGEKWQTKENWSENKVPTDVHDVIIPENTVVKITAGNQKAYSVTIEKGATLSINKKQSLTISDDLTNSGTFQSNLTSKFYPDIIIRGDYIADDKNGEATPVFRYKSFVSGSKVELKTPAVSLTFNELLDQNQNNGQGINLLKDVDTNRYLIGTYNNETEKYGTLNSDLEADKNTVLTPGIGYRMKGKTDSPAQGANVLAMTGTPRTGAIQIPLNFTGDTWNLIGNPYTSTIKTEAFLSANSSLMDDNYKAIYGWNGIEWVIINEANKNETGKKYLAPTQGFFVAAKSTGNIVFNSSMQIATTNTDDFITGRSTHETSQVTLALNNGNTSASTAIYFNAQGTSGFDPGYDAARFNQGNTTNLGIYTAYANNFNDIELGIQTLSNTALDATVVPLGVISEAGTVQTITASTTLSNTFIYLEDREKGVWHDLNKSSYTFSTPNAISGTGRFYVHVQSSALNALKLSNPKMVLTTLDQTINLHGNRNDALKVTVLGVRGSVVYKNVLDSHENQFTINKPAGVYIVKLENQNIQNTYKIILK